MDSFKTIAIIARRAWLIAVLCAVFLAESRPLWANEPQKLAAEKFQVCAKAYSLEVAKTHKSRNQGMMFREQLGEGQGMIFLFRQEQPQTFWMKNVSVPLDILFFNSKGKLVDSMTMAPDSPLVLDSFKPRYSSAKPAQFVVEIAGGSLEGFDKDALKNCQLSPIPKIDESVE